LVRHYNPRWDYENEPETRAALNLIAGGGIALATSTFKQVTGKRLVYRPLIGTKEVLSIGIARAKNGDITPTGEKFCEILRKLARTTTANK